MPKKIEWNDDLDNALRRLYSEENNQHDRAEIMGFCVPTLRRRARELGLTPRCTNKPAEPRPISKWAVELHREGHRPVEIAQITGLSKSAVNGIVWRARQRGDLPRA